MMKDFLACSTKMDAQGRYTRSMQQIVQIHKNIFPLVRRCSSIEVSKLELAVHWMKT